LRLNVKFPWTAWRGDLFGLVALAEFGRTNWRCIQVAQPKAFDHPDTVTEIAAMIAMARDERPGLAEEIIQQDASLAGYFGQVLTLSQSSHPNTLKLLEMAARVGEMVSIWFKLRFNRARLQQVWPAFVPMLQSPGHASYPSGHMLQSRLIAKSLAQAVPEASNALLALADRIGRNREVAGVHFPSDTAAGRAIADAAFPMLQGCAIYQTVLAMAQPEPAAPGALAPPPECV
jgi:acid phosphatase (class A)